MKGKWIKDYCPYAKDQGFDSVIGNVAPGESVFGFVHTLTASPEVLNFKTKTEGKVTMMANHRYRVLITKTAGGSGAAPVTVFASYFAPYKDQFTMVGDVGETYDIIVKGKIGY